MFQNVNVVKKANLYFDGKVSSRTVIFPNGEKKTLGIMLPGEYTFGTADKELMEILGGEAEVLLPGEENYQTFTEGTSFYVPANSSFKLVIKSTTDYCCSYINTNLK